MATLRTQESFLGLSVAAAIIAFGFYPMTLAPIGPLTNGGALGLTSISLALLLAWSAFMLNCTHRLTRIVIQLPMTGGFQI
jgi:hypothetical protein